MTTRTLLVLFAATFAAALLAFAPLSLLAGGRLAAAGLTANSVQGSIWGGALRGAAWQGRELGDVRARLAPIGFLFGRPGLRFQVKGAAVGTGIVEAGPGGGGLRGADLAFPSRLLAPRAPLDGRVVLEDFTARFDKGRCAAAKGRVRFELAQLGGAPTPKLVLSGKAACQDGALIAPLSGDGPGVKIDARLHLDAAGRYRIETQVTTTDANLGLALGLAGFERTLDGSRRVDEGSIAANADR